MNENKKVSYRQLAKTVENGRDLVHRLSQRCMQYERTIEVMKGQMLSAQAFVGLAILANNEDAKMTISKALISDFIQNKIISGEETEDKQAIIITVKEAPKHDENDATTEAGEVQQPQDDSGRNIVPFPERSNEIQGTETIREGEGDNGTEPTTEV